ncbi:MAG TPA: hypothetical protein VII55_03340 [Candidatus Saccharimonadales bacterium]
MAVGKIDVSDRAALAVGTLELFIGNNWDREKAYAGFTSEFGRIAAELSDVPHETYPNLPLGRLSTGGEVTVQSAFDSADSVERPDGSTYPAAYPFSEGQSNLSRRIWTPGEGFDAAAVNRLSMPGEPDDPQAMKIHARAALMDGPEAEDPILKLLGLSFDKESPDYQEGQPTQIEELARLTAAFEAEHPGLNHRAVILGGFVTLNAQRRLEGRETGVEVPMIGKWGYIRFAYQGRKTVGGVSWVGGARSYGDRLGAGGSGGRAYSREGLGFSVGLSEA